MLSIFGNDYNTPDGTCLRDYIDVVDLAKAHVAAVNRMVDGRMKEKYEIFNVGTGNPCSVLELVEGFIKANGVNVWADTTLANNELGWKAERAIEDTLRSAWAWEKRIRGIK